MKRAAIALALSVSLMLGFASVAAGASITHLQMINDVLYPDPGTAAPATAWVDQLCDGMAPCLTLTR